MDHSGRRSYAHRWVSPSTCSSPFGIHRVWLVGSATSSFGKEQEDQPNGMVGTGRFELPTPRTPSECSTRLSHVPTGRKPAASFQPQRMGLTQAFYTSSRTLRRFAPRGRAGTPVLHE